MTTGAKWHESGLVFTTPIGTPMEPANVNKIFAGLCARSGVRVAFAFTICATPARRCCMSSACQSRTSKMCSAIQLRSSQSCSTSMAPSRCSGPPRTGWGHSSRAWTNDVGVRLGQSWPGDRGMMPWLLFESQHLTSSEASCEWSWRGDSNPQRCHGCCQLAVQCRMWHAAQR